MPLKRARPRAVAYPPPPPPPAQAHDSLRKAIRSFLSGAFFMPAKTIFVPGMNFLGARKNLSSVSSFHSPDLSLVAFSKATKDKSGEWNEETLDKFFLAPKKFIPGTKMVFAGMKKAPDRKDLIAFLKESCA